MVMKTFIELDRVDAAVKGLVKRIPTMSETQIIATAKHAEQLGRQAFLIRGACVFYLLENGSLRLKGGRGKRDQERKGIRAQLQDIATCVGVHRRTLEIDARIYKTFFAVRDKDERGGALTAPLPREIYLIALAAPDPKLAIEEANLYAADNSYGRKQFRARVREMRSASEANLKSPRKLSPLAAVKIRLPAEARQALSELEIGMGKTADQVIVEAIFRLHKTYLKRPKIFGQAHTNRAEAFINQTPVQKTLLF